MLVCPLALLGESTVLVMSVRPLPATMEHVLRAENERLDTTYPT
jgi:hypothetical protein